MLGVGPQRPDLLKPAAPDAIQLLRGGGYIEADLSEIIEHRTIEHRAINETHAAVAPALLLVAVAVVRLAAARPGHHCLAALAAAKHAAAEQVVALRGPAGAGATGGQQRPGALPGLLVYQGLVGARQVVALVGHLPA
jgi:hypothetical protein